MQITYSHGVISPEEVVKYLFLTGQGRRIYSEIIKIKEAVKKTEELGVTVTDEEIQLFSDQFRRSRGLYAVGETLNFLKDSGITEEDLDSFCEGSVLTNALKEYLSDKNRVKEYYISNKSDFDLAQIYIIVLKEEGLANELMIQIKEENADFHKLARMYSIDEETRFCGGYKGAVSRSMLSPIIAAKVFNAATGDVLGPIQEEGFFNLILVEHVIKPELDDNVTETIKEKLLNEWLSQYVERITVSP